jgi:BirA family biotin operon repressor/biotin-[acetyl-CoA-carboxylase] ligase
MTRTIFYFDSVNSTNDEAKKLVENHKVMSGLVISDHQKKGRGRFGNNWISMKGNFMGSAFFPVCNYNCIDKLQYEVLKIILNLFVKITKKNNFKIKKPNDILVGDKKVCGILIESFVNNNKLFAIIGVGVNFVKNPLLKKYKATNFKKEFNKSISALEFSRILNQEMKKIIV